MDKNSVELGDLAKDTVTGFSGTVVAITTWLHGCSRIILQPKVGKDGKVPESSAFDEPQVVVVKKKVVAVANTNPPKRTAAPGGPRDDAAATRRNA